MHNDLNVQFSNTLFNENNIDKASKVPNELNMHLLNTLMAENIEEASNKLYFQLSNTLITESNINEFSALHIEGLNLLQFGNNLSKPHTCSHLSDGMLFASFDIALHYCLEFG